MKLAVITYQDRGAYAVETVPDEDNILSDILDKMSIDYSFEVWSDSSVDWNQYDVLLLKSPWDYFDYYQEFLDWCIKIKSFGIPVFNAIEIVLWNANKSYLLELQKLGLGIVPTIFFERGSFDELKKYLVAADQSNKYVIKPAISGGSKNTLRFNAEEFDSIEPTLEGWLASESYLLQPFLPEISIVGEYSYIFFNGEFSHAVLKKAVAGEFRVQHFFGGSIHSINPDRQELEIIQTYIDKFAADTLYARVDGIWRGSDFLLMELELIEPYLFLFSHPKAEENYARAIQARLQQFI